MQIGFFGCVQYFNLRVTYLTPWLNYHNFLKFNMATAILDFQNLISEQRFLGYRFSITVPNIDRRGNYGPKTKSKMAAVRHLVFSKIRFLSTGTHWASDFLSLYKNVDRRRNYGRKPPPLDRSRWNLARRSGPTVRYSMPNFIGATCRPCGAKNPKIGPWVNEII